MSILWISTIYRDVGIPFESARWSSRLLVYIKVLPFENGLAVLGELDVVLSAYVRMSKQTTTLM